MIEATIARDSEGFPSLVTLQDGAKRLEVAFDRDTGFTISGSRRSFTTELLDVLRMIYPATIDFKMDIPQPLQTTVVAGGKVVLFDDVETLLKWTELGATVAVDNTNAYNGDQSLEISAALGAIASGVRYFPMPHSKKLELSTIWAVDNYAKLDYLIWEVGLIEDNMLIYGSVRYNRALTAFQYWTAAGAWATFQTYPPVPYELADVGGGWNKLTVQFDFATRFYGKAFFNQYAQDINQQLYHEDSGDPRQAYVNLRVDATVGQDVNAWFDDIIVTEVT